MLQEITGKVLKARAEVLKLPNGRPYIEGRQTYAIHAVDSCEGPGAGVCLGFLCVGVTHEDTITAFFRGWSEQSQFQVSFNKHAPPSYGWYEICRLIYARTGFLLVERWPDDRVRTAAYEENA